MSKPSSTKRRREREARVEDATPSPQREWSNTFQHERGTAGSPHGGRYEWMMFQASDGETVVVVTDIASMWTSSTKLYSRDEVSAWLDHTVKSHEDYFYGADW